MDLLDWDGFIVRYRFSKPGLTFVPLPHKDQMIIFFFNSVFVELIINTFSMVENNFDRY
jgi:hypothetical protein